METLPETALQKFARETHWCCIVLLMLSLEKGEETPVKAIIDYLDEVIDAQTDPDRRALATRMRGRIGEQGFDLRPDAYASLIAN